MRKLIVILLPLFIASCSVSIGGKQTSTPVQQTSVPLMPHFTTEEEKACARSCQETYAQCIQGCNTMSGGAITAEHHNQCLENCNQMLKDCYSTCK